MGQAFADTRHLTLSVSVVLAVALAACATTPLGRKQLHLFPSSLVAELGEQAFDQIKRATPRLDDAELNDYVACIATAITSSLDSTDWEVLVFDQESVNAFALPGRKIGIYRGLLALTESQDQLATVIAHEIAHVLAEHANERLSTEYLVQVGFDAIRGKASASPEALAALGVGVQIGILLPYNRVQEGEADLLGLRLMAQAGFNPDAAVALWQIMDEQSQRRVPEFLSTHPADERRIASIQGRLPEARGLYREAIQAGKPPRCELPAIAREQ